MVGLTALAIATLVSSILGTTASIGASHVSARTAREANEANIAFQREVNAQEMAYNSAEAEKQRQWEEQMSNTQVQRAMADYQAAGLNPLLAIPGGASYGGGASATASLTAPKKEAISGSAEALKSISSAASNLSNLLLVSALFGSGKGVLANQLKKGGLSTSAAKAAAKSPFNEL